MKQNGNHRAGIGHFPSRKRYLAGKASDWAAKIQSHKKKIKVFPVSNIIATHLFQQTDQGTQKLEMTIDSADIKETPITFNSVKGKWLKSFVSSSEKKYDAWISFRKIGVNFETAVIFDEKRYPSFPSNWVLSWDTKNVENLFKAGWKMLNEYGFIPTEFVLLDLPSSFYTDDQLDDASKLPGSFTLDSSENTDQSTHSRLLVWILPPPTAEQCAIKYQTEVVVCFLWLLDRLNSSSLEAICPISTLILKALPQLADFVTSSNIETILEIISSWKNRTVAEFTHSAHQAAFNTAFQSLSSLRDVVKNSSE